jgi:hypothetical protein
LDELILPASGDQLRDFKHGRREILWAIESLLRWPETSLNAARITMKLATSENENFGNNATSILQMFFHVHLSGSPLPLEERFTLIDELLSTGDTAARMLAAKAVGSALQVHELRFGPEVDPLSNKSFPPEWRPKVNADIWNPRRKAISYLEKIITESDEAAALARNGPSSAVYCPASVQQKSGSYWL